MRATYTIDEKLGYVATTLEGGVTLAELGAHIQSVWADPAWKKEFNGLLDFTAASIDLSDGEIQELSKAMMSDPRCSFGRWAFVVATSADFAKLRKIDEVAYLKSTLRIFFDRRAAESWLLTPAGSVRKGSTS